MERSKKMIKLDTNAMGKRLKELRSSRGISHEKLAEDIKNKNLGKISSDSLKAYEVSDDNHSKAGNQKGMTIKNLITLANYYDVSVDYILGIEKEKKNSIHYICTETGLSENAVENLMKYNPKYDKDRPQLFEVSYNSLNALLENNDLMNLLNKISKHNTLEAGIEKEASAFAIYRELMDIIEK
jgi:transcriptional regulator with XRE-family HTH domain